MPLHRVISAVQAFLMLLAALALARLYDESVRRWGALAGVMAVALALSPAILERVRYVSESNAGGEKNLAVYATQESQLAGVFASLRQRGGRVYPGLVSSWGYYLTVGAVPVYQLLTDEGIPSVSYLAHSLSMPGDLVPDFNELRPAEYRLFNIQSLLAPAKYRQLIPQMLSPRLEAGDFVVFNAPGNGYFDVVDVPAAAPADKTTVYASNKAWLQSDWLEHKAYLLFDFFHDAPPALPRIAAAGPLPATAAPASDPGRVISQQQNGDIYQAEVEAGRLGFVLFKMTWHPNWKVLVDGNPVKTAMLSPGFVGVPVRPGRHRIWCRYEPGNWKPVLAVAGLFCVLLLGAAERFGHLPGARSEPLPAPAEPPPTVAPEFARVKTEAARSRKRRAFVK